MLNEQLDNTSLSDNIWNSILSIYSRTIYAPVLLPLPSYILYPLYYLTTSKLILSLFQFIFGILSTALLYNLYYQLHKHVHKPLILLFALIICPVHLVCIFEKNNAVSLLFINLAFYHILQSNELCASLLVGIATSSSFYAVSTLIYFIYYKLVKLYKFSVNPKNSVMSIFKKLTVMIIQVLLIPVIIFILSVCIDLSVRNNSSNYSANYSLKFQTRLNNFNIDGKINNFDEPLKLNTSNSKTEDVNMYVIDRSIISLINIKHKSFLLNESSTDQEIKSNFFEIQKVFSEEFDDEEPRFIKNGDIVKMKYVNEEKYLGVKKDTTDKKLKEVIFAEFENDDDLWKVECNGYLTARSQFIQLMHVNKGIYLGCSRIYNNLIIHASHYSDKKSRLFCIANNTNHLYFKHNFSDLRANSIIEDFTKLTFVEAFFEYISAIISNTKDEWIIFKNEVTNNKSFTKNLSKIACIYSLILLFILTVMLIINNVFKNKKMIAFNIDRITYELVINAWINILWFIIGFRNDYIMTYFNLAACISAMMSFKNMEFTNMYKKQKVN